MKTLNNAAKVIVMLVVSFALIFGLGCEVRLSCMQEEIKEPVTQAVDVSDDAWADTTHQIFEVSGVVVFDTVIMSEETPFGETAYIVWNGDTIACGTFDLVEIKSSSKEYTYDEAQRVKENLKRWETK